MKQQKRGSAAKERLSGDIYVDKLLSYIYEQGNDPYRIKDSSKEFTQNLLFISLKVSMKLYDCYVVGLKSLHRSDHCTIWEVNGRMHVKAILGAGILHYSGLLQITKISPTISFEIDISYIEIKVEFSFEVENGRNFTLHDLRVGDLRGVNVGIAGLGPVNWLINPVINQLTSVFATFLKKSLEEKLRVHLRESGPEFKLPFDKTDDENYN